MLASLRFDYISSSLNAIKPQYHFEVTDKYDVVFLTDDNNETSDAHSNMLTTPLQRLDWRSLFLRYLFIKNFKPVGCRRMYSYFIFNVNFIFTRSIYVVKTTNKTRKTTKWTTKIELVGTFAASTAHEIRNPLTGIKGLVALLKEKYKDEQDQFYFSIIEQEIERINEIVSEFLILGKPTAIIEQTYDVRTILNEVALIIQSEANLHNIVFHLHLPDRPVHIRCSKDHMKQVVLNITKMQLKLWLLAIH